MGNSFLLPLRIKEALLNWLRNLVDMNWPLPDLQRSQILWKIGSSIVCPLVGTFSKVMTDWLNKFEVYNREILYNALDKRPADRPLVTVCNHNSCLDDPLIWGTLKWWDVVRASRVRWSIAAHDICFTQMSHAIFFGFGKTVPVIRGKGVYQKALDFCIERLNKGEWIHIFPEGKVNVTREFMRIKWGVGRLIAECKVCPIVIPMWHVGMDSVLPNVEPYRPNRGKRVTLVFGEPIQLEGVVEQLKKDNKSDVEQRKTITDIIQEELKLLKIKAESLHFRNGFKMS